MTKPALDSDVLVEMIEHVETRIDGQMPTRVLMIEFFEGDVLPNVELFGCAEQSREEAISLFGESLMALGMAIQSVNAEGAN